MKTLEKNNWNRDKVDIELNPNLNVLLLDHFLDVSSLFSPLAVFDVASNFSARSNKRTSVKFQEKLNLEPILSNFYSS